MKMIYKGRIIEPYESFYHIDSIQFFRGSLGGGLSRCVKCDDSLAVMEVIYEDLQDVSVSERSE